MTAVIMCSRCEQLERAIRQVCRLLDRHDNELVVAAIGILTRATESPPQPDPVLYLRHLVDTHGVEETAELWRLDLTHFDELHHAAHSDEVGE